MSPRPGTKGPRIAMGSTVAWEEDLPAPLVYYPGQNGTFCAFAPTREAPPVLCACAEGAVRNLFRLAAEPGRLEPLDYAFFPDVVLRLLLEGRDPLSALRFRRGLCHRCNLVKPTLRYCHMAGGPLFVQTYGWYINQTYLRLGIHPSSHRYLPDVCPPEYHDVLGRIQALTEQARSIRAGLAALMNGPRRELGRKEQSHWPNVTLAEFAPLETVELQLNRPRYELGSLVQNATRAEFGVRPIGEGWISETQLYRIVCRLFPGEQVLRRHRPEWLEGLELDIYLPGRRLALEYQGQQHFHPIKAWGGEQALHDLQVRDARKAAICREAAVTLIPILYTEPLTDDHIEQRVAGN